MVTVENLDQAADVDKCAREPIHIIGHIQSHGMLFALSEPDLVVRQVSVNVSALLGSPPETLLDRTFEDVLGAQQFALFRSLALSKVALEEKPLPVQLAGGALAVLCAAHRRDGVLIVELELQDGAFSFEPLSLNAHVRLPLSRLELSSDIAELSAVAAGDIRRLSGFDRVMVYRFDEEWNGEVIAESAVPSPVSYLGLRFPASDIPAQARRLFLKNRVRAIADVNASPVPIVPEIGPITGRPLDLTFSFLRSPASIHLEYLRNMGVQSSLTVSILARQQLWGLIACHSASPHHVDYSTRSLCELIGQVLGTQVALRMDNSALQRQLAYRGLLDDYLAQIDAPDSVVFADCFHKHRLLELFSADGLVLSLGGAISAHGHSLEPNVLLPLLDGLRALSSNGVASSNMLSALDCGVNFDASEISGALFMDLGGEIGDYLVLLRRELVTTVTWAGNPDKSVNTDTEGRLHPRGSFHAWQEHVHGRSRPWSELELEGARALRAHLLQRRASFESAWSEQRFRFLADSMPQLIWTAKPDGKVDYYNLRWLNYTGTSVEHSSNWGWETAVHPDDLAHCLARWRKTIATERGYELECRLKRASDSTYRWHVVRVFPLRNPKGEVANWVGTATDIEEQKQARKELERRVAERTAELIQANEELDNFAYVASHDLKAPLRAIHNSAIWIEEDLEEHLTGETREHLSVLRGRVKRMEKLLDDLLEYARIGRPKDNRYGELIKGDVLIHDMLALLSVEGFTVEVSPYFANIEVHRLPLQQILMNLISNGIKHHHKKTGTITVTVEDDGDFYAFAVKDDGPGIDAQFHDQIFEMFRTLRPRDQVEGSGMGLAMVRKHVEKFGGKVRLESAEGQGSTFRFTWPKRPQQKKSTNE